LAYLGNRPAEAYSAFQKQDFSTSATTSYTLDHPVSNQNEIALFINFVRQEPTAAYTASGTTLTLTSATASSDDMYCVYLGKAVQTVNPPSGSVGNSQVASTIITGQTAETSIATDDTILIHDTSASALRKMTRANFISGVGGTNTPAFFVTKTSNQSISDSTFTDVIFETEEIDTDGAFASNTTFTVPSGAAGKYFAFGTVRFQTSTDFSYALCRIVHNSTNVVSGWDRNDDYTSIHAQCMVTLAEGDTLKLQCRQQSGGALNIGANDQGHVTYFGGYKIIE
jgi:hypothetical protein